MPLGDRLREERERLGFNQTDFAALAGSTRKTQFNYESGERTPDAAYLAAISAAGADVSYLVTGKRFRKEVNDKLLAALRLSIELEPSGGSLTDKALAAIRAVGSDATADDAPSYIASNKDEQSLLDNYRASNESGKQALQVTAAALAAAACQGQSG